MKDQKEDNAKGGVSPVMAAVTGAVVGAGVAIAGVLLSDAKNRKKIVDTATKVKDSTAHFVKKTQKQIEDEKEILEKHFSDDKLKVEQVVASAKNSIDKTTKQVNSAVKSL